MTFIDLVDFIEDKNKLIPKSPFSLHSTRNVELTGIEAVTIRLLTNRFVGLSNRRAYCI
jgi:hypothetical protein